MYGYNINILSNKDMNNLKNPQKNSSSVSSKNNKENKKQKNIFVCGDIKTSFTENDSNLAFNPISENTTSITTSVTPSSDVQDNNIIWPSITPTFTSYK
jgi:hypothetical protein